MSIYSIAKDKGLPLTRNIGKQVSYPENPCSDIIYVGGCLLALTYRTLCAYAGEATSSLRECERRNELRDYKRIFS